MTTQSDSKFFIVGVGTSAGGLEALEKFFSHMPMTSNIAFVVLQHLSPDYKSHMVELLSRHTSMTVTEAEDGLTVVPNTVYLLPRSKNMTLYKGKLFLVDYKKRDRKPNLPIDIFFESLAKDMGERAVGVVLSGTGSDGTRGIRAIKEAGGLVMVQDKSAKFDGMPLNALATQLVDIVASPEAMPDSLIGYVKHYSSFDHDLAFPQIDTGEKVSEKLLAVLQAQTNVDFTGYKSTTLQRRIERRMGIHRIDHLTDYVDFLQDSPEECRALCKEFLIGVTRFFRDPEAFDLLQRKVMPVLFSRKTAKDQLRVWVPGCASGEEVYSLAIIIHEYIEQTGQFVDVKIFATDLDKESLDRASAGIYPDDISFEVTRDRLHKYFIKKGNAYEILPRLRASVVFAHQNLIKDPPLSKMDLISCRNLLIYFQPNLQQKALQTFKFSLKPGGCLFLGTSESLGKFSDEFQSLDNKWKVYLYQGGPGRLPKSVGLEKETQPPVRIQGYRQLPSPDDWRSSDPVLRSLVEHVMPPCIVVNESRVMVHAFGNIGQYLTVPSGYRVNLDILKMVQEELKLPLSTGLARVNQEQQELVYQNVVFQDGNNVRQIKLLIRPFWEQNYGQQLFLIIFETEQLSEETVRHIEEFDVNQTVKQHMMALERELQYNKESLQATIEELETANEELQATNEELMASNEELQSTNEELQSVNEELHTVNAEYQMKIRELIRLNNDMDNLLTNTNIGTVFLDNELNVRRFTPGIQDNINLLKQDVGRPLHHLSHKLKDLDLSELARRVLSTQTGIEQQVTNQRGQSYLLRVMPYRTHTDQIDGVVLVLIDVAELSGTKFQLGEDGTN
ncbi:MAG: PAS domain-containing protein [Anaerolineae bacterium]|nr:PAS domain-containing protein [Anaerolineae bacterium]